MRLAAKFFKLDEIHLLADFNSYKQSGVVGTTFKAIMERYAAYIVASADAERGFSLMNEIMTDDRNRLLILNLSNLMFVSSISMPVNKFDAKKYVRRWLSCHQPAESTRNSGRKSSKRKNPYENLFYLF